MHNDVQQERNSFSVWLCPTELQRLRFLDMHARVKTARRVQGATIALSVLFSARWFGWWPVVLTLMAVVTLAVLEKVYVRTTHPEIASAASIATLQIILAANVAVTGGASSPLLPFLMVPAIMLAARFRQAVVVCGVAASLVLLVAAILAAAFWLPTAPTVPPVVNVVAYLALLASLVTAQVTLLSAELESRGDAVVDQLTGLFNRKAMHGRFAEAAAQAKLINSPISLVICDLDLFKNVNDEHGHDRGDLVLQEVAFRMRKTMRVLDLVYRIGGEEFVILLPGQDEQHALQLAERVIADIEAEPITGLRITMSAGVATSSPKDIEFDALLKRADLALYSAKRAGRNRVHAASAMPSRLDARP